MELPSIAIVKQTNGQIALNPPGPIVAVGSTVTWTYDVTTPGNEPLKNVTVVDDNGTPADPADDFNPTPILVAGGFNVGDTNKNGLLDPGEDWKYTFNGTAKAGQYENTVVTTAPATSATPRSRPTASATTSPRHRSIAIVKQTNGQVALTPHRPERHGRQHRDVDLRRHQPGQRAAQERDRHRRQRHARRPRRRLQPHAHPGRGGFNVGDTNQNGLLDPGEVWTYSASKAAIMGQYTNNATVPASARPASRRWLKR